MVLSRKQKTASPRVEMPGEASLVVSCHHPPSCCEARRGCFGNAHPPPAIEEGLITADRERDVCLLSAAVKTNDWVDSLREAQALLLRKAASRAGREDKMAAALMRHVEREKKKLRTSVKTSHTQRGQYSVHFSTAKEQKVSQSGFVLVAMRHAFTMLLRLLSLTVITISSSFVLPAGGQMGGGAGRLQVTFTPTICKVRCSQDRCVNYCERGNVTTLYSGAGEPGGGRRDGSRRPGFRLFLCPLLCKNGGVCLQKDRCLCPLNFTGKFCQIPVNPHNASTNEIAKPALLSDMAANRELTRSEFLLPLAHNQEVNRAGAPSPSMVKVRVQHPPEASVKIHQVLKTLSSSSGSAGPPAHTPAPAGRGVQAQTVRGGGTYTQQSGFKYCFREVRDGQCSSPLPGLRSREMCCRGIGKAWGISDCVLCPPNTGPANSSCPHGFEWTNGTCVDVNECLRPGLCDNGICVNTRGSYSCVCQPGFILDATHGICISQSVISEEKGQCFRVLESGRGPSSCSLPILKHITKQICCCSRVGKAWGPNCQRCPHFGSGEFKEICPAGPGYRYSPSTVKFHQIALERLGTRGAPVVTEGNQDKNQGDSTPSDSGAPRPQKPSPSGGSSTSDNAAASTKPGPAQPKPQPPSQPKPQPPVPPRLGPDSPSSRPVQPGTTATQSRPDSSPSSTAQQRPQPPSTGTQAGGQPSSTSRSNQPTSRGLSLPAPALPQSPEHGSRPSGERPPPPPPLRPPENRAAAVRPTSRPARVQSVKSVCDSRPGVCGRGRCVNQPGGKHICDCDRGFQPNNQRTHCQDMNECLQSPSVCPVGECVNSVGSFRCICPSGFRSNNQQTDCQDVDECLQNPCINGRCDNTPGSYRCVCRHGYSLDGNTCTDVDECANPLRCPGQECTNTPGSYRCVACQSGFGLLNGVCTDIDECRQSPCSNARCENSPGSYRCVCHHGYRLQNNTCTDVDECAEPSQCPGQVCVNSVGSYRCVSCRPGYTLVNRQCTDINECEDSVSCPGQQCVNTDGSYRCVGCRHGYHSVRGVCTDVDECATVGACEPERVCVNTVGSFRCDCPPGYRTTGLGRQCRDVNECLVADHCFSRGECVNTPGSYTCECSRGFMLSDNRTACLDVDECARASVCADGRCVNTEGSFYCQCRGGFTVNPERTACLDMDECVSSGGSVCGSHRCENTIGSYRCLVTCEPGYRDNHAGGCEGESMRRWQHVTHTGVLVKVKSFQGYVRIPKSVCFFFSFWFVSLSMCVLDVDECTTVPGACGSARCENVDGSFTCVCDQAGEAYDAETKRCLSTVPPALLHAVKDLELGIYIRYRLDGSLFDLRCLAAKTKVLERLIAEALFADDCALMAHEENHLQTIVNRFSIASKMFGLTISLGKTEVLFQPALNSVCQEPNITIDGTQLKSVDTFKYLGTTISNDASLDKEVAARIQKASQATDASVISGHSSSSFHVSVLNLPPPLPPPRPGELRECYYNLADRGTCSLLATNTSQQECCCTVGEGWGLGCQYTACPPPGTVEFLTLCPSGRGYVTDGAAAFSYRDVDECKRFHPEVCKSGVCVNNIPSYSCYCSNGYVYNATLLECIDHDECEEESCVGGICVNTVGSFYCSCPPPLVLDDTQINCVNSSLLTLDESLSFCWQHVTTDFLCQSPLLGGQVTFTDCCCLYGQAWGMGCALCPPSDSEEYSSLCSSYPPLYPDRFTDPDPGPGPASPNSPPFGLDFYPSVPRPDFGRSDYDDYSPAGGSREIFRGRTPSSFSPPEEDYRRSDYSFYSEADFGPPDGSRPPSSRLPPDPRADISFGSRSEGPPLGLAPLPGVQYDDDDEEEEEERRWRPGLPFPPFRDRSRGGGPGGAPRRVYERRYEPYASLSTAEDCGILHGCENGRCIRVAEGYTCDCYHGYELDMTTMTCIDMDECEGGSSVEFPCVNARCVNTEGSFRCVCRRGYIMSRRPNHCVAA
ncbi:LOW QUALITY PROTEIN: latent-transforming growth factor beta-binding protein 4 [Pholidichthys leucotaenia]